MVRGIGSSLVLCPVTILSIACDLRSPFALPTSFNVEIYSQTEPVCPTADCTDGRQLLGGYLASSQ